MNKADEIIARLLEIMNAAIESGDWKINKINDPKLIMQDASYHLERHGYRRDSITGETWIKS